MKSAARKVSLWWLLIALAAIFCCGVQISTNMKSYSNQRSVFIQSLADSAGGVSQNLSAFSSDISTTEDVEQSLISACSYSKNLESLLDCVPRHTILGFEQGAFDGLGNAPLQTFSFVSSWLTEILNEYQAENSISEESLSTICLISQAFSSFHDNLEGHDNISQRELINYMNTLYATVYP